MITLALAREYITIKAVGNVGPHSNYRYAIVVGRTGLLGGRTGTEEL